MRLPSEDCPACAEAECKSCAARDLARGPAFFEASLAGALTPTYRSALQAAFGADWLKGHDQVKYWAEKLGRARA